MVTDFLIGLNVAKLVSMEMGNLLQRGLIEKIRWEEFIMKDCTENIGSEEARMNEEGKLDYSRHLNRST